MEGQDTGREGFIGGEVGGRRRPRGCACREPVPCARGEGRGVDGERNEPLRDTEARLACREVREGGIIAQDRRRRGGGRCRDGRDPVQVVGVEGGSRDIGEDRGEGVQGALPARRWREDLRPGRREPREHPASPREVRDLGEEREQLHPDADGDLLAGVGVPDEHDVAQLLRRGAGRQVRAGVHGAGERA